MFPIDLERFIDRKIYDNMGIYTILMLYIDITLAQVTHNRYNGIPSQFILCGKITEKERYIGQLILF